MQCVEISNTKSATVIYAAISHLFVCIACIAKMSDLRPLLGHIRQLLVALSGFTSEYQLIPNVGHILELYVKGLGQIRRAVAVPN